MNADQQWPDCEREPNAEEFRKLFVGGLDTKTTEETLKDYFSSYGTIESCEIMKDRSTPPKSKGFGFITFKSPDNIDEIQKNRPHEIDCRKIETKRATPKQQQYWATKKLYIKDFPKDLKEEELEEEIKDVFGRYGTILNVKLIKDKDAKDSLKGFGFIEYNDEDPVDKCNLLRKFKVRGQEVYVSKAYPQDKSFPGGRGGRDYYEWEMYPPMFDYYGYPPYGGGRYNARRDYGYNYNYSGRGYQRGGGGGGGGRPYRGGGIKTSHPEDQVFVNTWSLFLLIVNQDFIKVTSLVLNKKKLCQLQKVIFLLQFLLRLSIEILRNRPLEFSNIEKM